MRVGFREGRQFDLHRKRWDGEGPRPIGWVCWYPTDDGAAETDSVSGPPSAPWFRIGPVVREGRLAEGGIRYPVVLLSHGTGGDALGLGWLGLRLARRGFVVIGAHHHGNTAIEPYRPEGFLCWWERARDLSVLLDQAETIPGLADRLDFGRVHAAGFSLGGHTAVALCGGVTEVSLFQAWAAGRDLGRGPREFPDLADQVPMLMERSGEFRTSVARQSDSFRDERIRSALLCAPGPPVRAFTTDSLAAIRQPVQIVATGEDIEAPATECAAWLHAHLPESHLTMLAPEAGHYVFLPESTEEGRRQAPDLCVDPVAVDRRSIHDAVAAMALELFETHDPS